MIIECKYDVLWIDDDTTIVNSTKSVARTKGINLVHYENWDSAEQELKKNYDKYSAIVLDGRCKVKENEVETEEFLYNIIPRLTNLYGEKRKEIPWYIYSGGTRAIEDFDSVTKRIGYNRNSGDWGEMVFIKASPNDKENLKGLCDTIIQAAKNQDYNLIKQRYKEVFQYLGEGKLIDSKVAYDVMLEALFVLHYPEKNPDYKYEGVLLRKVLEFIMSAAVKEELIPKECVNGKNFLADPCYYLMGNVTSGGLRYGKDGESIFPEYIGRMCDSIRKTMNQWSHGESGKTELRMDSDIYLGYVLHLCGIIKWFGKYASNQKNIETAKNKVRRDVIFCKNTYKIVEEDGTICAKALYKMPDKAKENLGEEIKIVELAKNTQNDSDKYPYFVVSYKINNK